MPAHRRDLLLTLRMPVFTATCVASLLLGAAVSETTGWLQIALTCVLVPCLVVALVLATWIMARPLPVLLVACLAIQACDIGTKAPVAAVTHKDSPACYRADVDGVPCVVCRGDFSGNVSGTVYVPHCDWSRATGGGR